MDIGLYIYLVCVVLCTICIFIGVFIEKKYDESHPVKKWWRRHVVGLDPEQKRPDDDIYE